jgi:hypothetical protein
LPHQALSHTSAETFSNAAAIGLTYCSPNRQT